MDEEYARELAGELNRELNGTIHTCFIEVSEMIGGGWKIEIY